VIFVCPTGFPFAAYGRVFFPPNHPRTPDDSTRPARCFASATQAQGAGYDRAPTPPGDLLAAGEYLVPPGSALGTTCAHAARILRVAIPCPGLVPLGWSPEAACAPCNGVFVLDGTFAPAPVGYVGVSAGSGHLNIWAIPSPSMVDLCPGGGPDGSVALFGTEARWVVCPQGSEGEDAGHIDLQWSAGGVRYGVSLHGHTAVNRALVLSIGRSVHMIGPWPAADPVAPAVPRCWRHVRATRQLDMICHIDT
jgi:hypothetical protein